MKRSLALVLAILVICGALAVPGLSTEAAAAPSDWGSTSPLRVNITQPTHDEILGSSTVTVIWESNVLEEDIWFCEVQLDSSAVQEAQAFTSHVFQDVAEGYHTIKVWIYNKTGALAYDSESFIVDLAAPSLTITSPADNAKLNTSTVNVTWSASDPSLISFFRVSLNGGSWQSLLPSVDHLEIDVGEGQNTFVIEAHDRAGKITTETVGFKVDITAPVVHIIAPANGTEFNHGEVTVSWGGSSADESLVGYQIWVDGVFKSFAATAAREDTRDYADGYHTVTIVAVDEAGNTASDSRTFYVDTTEEGTISGIVRDENGNPLAGAKVSLDDGQSVVTNETGAYSFQARAGVHELTITMPGFDTQTIQVELRAGEHYEVSDLSMVSSNLLSLLGVAAAVVAVVIVALLFFMSQRRKKKKGPPTARSWRGLNELQRRSTRVSRQIDDDDEDRL